MPYIVRATVHSFGQARRRSGKQRRYLRTGARDRTRCRSPRSFTRRGRRPHDFVPRTLWRVRRCRVGGISQIAPGEAVGLMGESGCGKSTLASALLGFLRAGGVRREGTVRIRRSTSSRFRPVSCAVCEAGARARTAERRSRADADDARSEASSGEPRAPPRADRAAANDEAVELLTRVRLPAPRRLLRRYPYELSGGQQQRVAIAIALAGKPELLVLDEPTTGLDVITQSRVLELLEEIRASVGAAMLYVSHDLGVIGEMCETSYVMYAGRIVEAGETTSLFRSPVHPYTRGPARLCPARAHEGLPRALPGAPPVLGDAPWVAPSLLAVRSRSTSAAARCPSWSSLTPHGRSVRCYRATASAARRSRSQSTRRERRERPQPGEATVTARNVTHRLRPDGRASLVRRLQHARGRPAPAYAVADVDLQVRDGETLALVGEAEAASPTLARAIAGLHQPGGRARYGEADLTLSARSRPTSLRRALQLVLQTPDTALNPVIGSGHHRSTAAALRRRSAGRAPATHKRAAR